MSQEENLLHKLVWSPKDPEDTRISRFRSSIAKKYGTPLPDYEAFWRWSCQNPAQFWKEVWEETGVIASKQADTVLPPSAPIYPPPLWFTGARLNFAENLLRHRNSQRIALIQSTEPDPTAPPESSIAESTLTYAQLYEQVGLAVHAMRARGVGKDDCIASYTSNCIENVVAFLAASALGAVWCSSAADFAPAGVLERLQTVRPKLLFGVNAVRYNGRVHAHTGKVEEVVQGLRNIEHAENEGEALQRLEGVVLIAGVEGGDHASVPTGCTSWDAFLKEGKEVAAAAPEAERHTIQFEQLDFNHPLWILFSSGTTGKPKAITHRAGGMLLQLSKEHLLHGGMTEEDVFFQFTTTGWMMHNFLMGGLVSGATLVLYDGSPLKPASVLWDLAARHGVTVFGTSAAYLSALERSGYKPRDHHKNLKVKQVLSTGSPLRADLYPFILDAIEPDCLIGSITGGSDICSLFAAHNVALPVRAGEVQARGLGMDVDVFDEAGQSVGVGKQGDLVCKTPFPVQPLGFWRQPESKYFDSYYAQVPGVWFHGDYVMLSESGGLLMLGRSDGILNAGGIRFGSSEIYEVLESAEALSPPSPLSCIEDSLVVPLKTPAGDDEVVVLFLVVRTDSSMAEGGLPAFEELAKAVQARIRSARSARHVPAFVRKIKAVPKTLNGKRVEVPVKKLINGAELSTINQATLQNPEVLQEYIDAGVALRAELARKSR